MSGFVIVWLRSTITFNTTHSETTVIPIILLTPFAVYLIAESFHTSGILSVVATGIVHNWESSKLKLTSTNVQLTQATIWQTISNILNSIVFIILGISLPTVWQEITKLGLTLTGQLLLLIYLTMFVVRFIWAKQTDNSSSQYFFGEHSTFKHTFYSRIFAISGVHGTVTLAMAFSLPKSLNNHAFLIVKSLLSSQPSLF